MAMTAKIEGKRLTVVIDLEDEPKRSGSGKTIVVASTHGNQVTQAQYQGNPVTIGLNAYYRA